MTKDVLTAFSPATDFLAVATADGRIKTWDVGSGHLRGEFVDVAASTSGAGIATKDGNGHLAVDYACIIWVSLPVSMKKGRTKGNKDGLLLVLGTAAGDVLAWDTYLGQLKWRNNDVNAGGVKALAKSKCGKILYVSGADGMICVLDSGRGHVVEKFRAAKTGVTCIAVSPDGGSLLTASSELKLFDLSSKKRIRKFAGHPAEVTALAFSQEGKYALSSARGERQVSVWLCDGNSSETGALFSLTCEQPALSLECSRFVEETGLIKVLAVSEAGVAYVWQATKVEELATVKPSTVSVAKSADVKCIQGCVLAGHLVTGVSVEQITVHVAHGTTAKPTFEHVPIIDSGTSIVLRSDAGELLLPASRKAVLDSARRTNITVLGHDNAADAVFSRSHVESDGIFFRNAKKRPASDNVDEDEIIALEDTGNGAASMALDEDDEQTMEDRLVALGIVEKEASAEVKPKVAVKVVAPRGDSVQVLLSQALHSDDSALLERCLAVSDQKVIKNTVRRLRPTEAGKLLRACMLRLETRPQRGVALAPWIRAVLLLHSATLMGNPSMEPVLRTLYQLIEARMTVFKPLLALSGRLDLITAQISARETGQVEKEEVEAVVYEEGESEIEAEEIEESASSDSEAAGNEAMDSDSEVEEEQATQ